MTDHRLFTKTRLLTVVALVLTLGLVVPVLASQESTQAAEAGKPEQAAKAQNPAGDATVPAGDAKAAAAAREAARAAACATQARAKAPVNTLEDIVAYWNLTRVNPGTDSTTDPKANAATADEDAKPVVWRKVSRP